MAWIARDLDRRGYPYAAKVREAAQLLASADQDGREAGCGQCGGPLPLRATGRPAVYCSSLCRKRSWRERNRDESRHSVYGNVG